MNVTEIEAERRSANMLRESIGSYMPKPILMVTPCIVPPRVREKNGYVYVSITHRNFLSHRLAWEIAYGVIPPGMTVDHLCRTTACVNVFHMELVTAAENVARGWKRGSHVFPERCPQGHEPNFRIDDKGHRICRECKRGHDRRRRAREKAARS